MNTVKAQLSKPISIDGQPVTELELREPTVASLQGLEISSVIRGQTDQLIDLLPKISEITKEQALGLSFKDLTTVHVAVVSFLKD